VHRNRLLGVLNLSNKRNGQPFDETDLDRAMMASAVLSLAMSQREAVQQQRQPGGVPAVEDPPVTGSAPAAPAPRSTEALERPPFEMHG